ncbi:hypothetical protein IAQ61_000018 [Plenodomus lingam]|uniref:uncharacterized protein n=1 Tax=Leptosphaeria maculans TaxID=5022 RepID=UPI003316681E|nr:hypothetical protein IAQ61_000018 [Plenodomus lingam]
MLLLRRVETSRSSKGHRIDGCGSERKPWPESRTCWCADIRSSRLCRGGGGWLVVGGCCGCGCGVGGDGGGDGGGGSRASVGCG